MFKSGKKINYIYFVDRHRSLFDSMLTRFRNTLKYSLKNFSSVDGLLMELEDLSLIVKRTRITVLVVDHRFAADAIENEILEFVTSVKKLDPSMNLIVVANKKESEAGQKINPPASYSFVQNNNNAMLKITNLVMGMISRENLEQKYISARWSVIMFVVVILVAVFFGVFSYLLR